MTTPKRFSLIHTQSAVKSLKRISPKISHFISLQGTVLQAERNWPHCGRIYESLAYGITSLLFFVFFFVLVAYERCDICLSLRFWPVSSFRFDAFKWTMFTKWDTFRLEHNKQVVCLALQNHNMINSYVQLCVCLH